MFEVDGLNIYLTRGDVAVLEVSAQNADGSVYTFQSGDVVRLNVCIKNHHENIVLTKEVSVDEEVTSVSISLSSSDTRIGELINKPTDYWYEIELNPDSVPQTIIGYDQDGPKIFRLYPEGEEQNE